MASVGPQMYSRLPPRAITSIPVPPPFLLTFTSSRRRHASPHVFRFNGCWSLFRLLLFAFRRFRSFPRSLPVTVLSPRTSPDPFSLISPMRSASCDLLLVRVSLSVVSSQFLSRTALNVSLLRYIAFVFRLLVCLVPSHRGHWHVYQKALRAKAEDIFA
jgi:hypothetical protein